MECCQRLLPLIIHSILLDDSDGSWRSLLSSHIQDFFGFCSRSAQASSRSATPLNSDSGWLETNQLLSLLSKIVQFVTLNRNDLGICYRFVLNVPSESDSASQGLYDKTSLRTMLAVIDHLRHQQRPVAADRFAPFLNEMECSSLLFVHLIGRFLSPFPPSAPVAQCVTQTSG